MFAIKFLGQLMDHLIDSPFLLSRIFINAKSKQKYPNILPLINTVGILALNRRSILLLQSYTGYLLILLDYTENNNNDFETTSEMESD